METQYGDRRTYFLSLSIPNQIPFLILRDVDQNYQNIYLFLLSQEVGFDGGRLRYLGMGASAISTAILEKEREENI